MKKNINLLITGVLLSSLMVGCSDGNSGNSEDSVVAEYNAIFVDSAVSNITWVCGDRSGVTDAGGHFGACPVGESVSFSMGKINLGTITDTSSFGDPANTIITPTTLATASGDPEVAKKISITLQSFDSDGDPTNGITIDDATIAVLEELEEPVDLTSPTQTVESVEASSAETVSVIVEATGNNEMRPVTAEEAQIHLEVTEQAIQNGEITPPEQPTNPITTGATGSN